MKPIVRVENISKSYRIGGLDAGYLTLRETLAKKAAAPLKRLRRRPSAQAETLWALKDINFDVQQGEIVGLIGHNGAGKSTLLKVLSRITVPTTGRTEVYGRIGSLLEVGTGFHPDLTGRENIYLNGTILGIKRAEITAKFDEIVAFSGIAKFIDTPVKWYSSGMYLRLAFSVAVNLSAEVLVMDEVLAVGDTEFQQKCLDKMYDITRQGRTILFVSHNMSAVTRLCKRAILFDKGRMVNDGPAYQVVNEYMGESLQVTAERAWPDLQSAPGDAVVRLRRVRIRNEEGETVESRGIQSRVGVELTYEVLQPDHVLTPKVDVLNEGGAHLFTSHDVSPVWRRRPRPTGLYVSTIWFPGNFFSEGNLLVHAGILSHFPTTVTHVQADRVVTFQVVDNQAENSARGDYVGPMPGIIRPLFDWTTDLGATDNFAPDAMKVTLSE